MLPIHFYRYENVYTFEGVSITLRILNGIKETRKGFWVYDDKLHKKRFVLKYAKSSFCKPTEEQALQSFIHRRLKQIGILKSQLEIAQITLQKARNKEFNKPTNLEKLFIE